MQAEEQNGYNPSDVILENLLDAVLIVNINGDILYANKAAEKLFERSSPELLNQNFGYPVAPFEVHEIEVINSKGVAIVQMLASVINWKLDKAFLLSLRDITSHKDALALLEIERKNLEITSFENEQYASLASHDLKEPIRKILIFGSLLIDQLMKAPQNEVMLKHAQKIQQSANRMKLLMHGIADFSALTKRLEAFTATDLCKVVADVCLDLDMVIKERRALINTDALPIIDAIPVQMHQLFLNIISNAIKYSKPDVIPVIQIRCEEREENMIGITISDNGIGFENEYASKIFQPFARLHTKNYDGSGIGLAICKKIVEGHGGKIGVQSAPSKGSEFFFTLLKTREGVN